MIVPDKPRACVSRLGGAAQGSVELAVGGLRMGAMKRMQNLTTPPTQARLIYLTLFVFLFGLGSCVVLEPS